MIFLVSQKSSASMSSHLTVLERVKSCVFSTPYMTCKTVWKISIKKYWTSSKGKSVLVVLAFGKCSFFSWKAGLIIHPQLHSQPFRPNIFTLCLSPKYVNFITKVKQICLSLRDFAISSYRIICGLDINENIASWTEERRVGKYFCCVKSSSPLLNFLS